MTLFPTSSAGSTTLSSPWTPASASKGVLLFMFGTIACVTFMGMQRQPFQDHPQQPIINLGSAMVSSLSWMSSSRQQSVDVVGEGIEETGFSQSIAVSKLLVDETSPYQRIQVYEAAKPYYGRILVLDGVLQLAEGDAAAYNEMMAHVALFQHPHPQRVLVIGGGDGYVVAEVLKHPSVQHVDHVDLDEHVIGICKKYFPQWNKWSDPRVHLHITDGAAYCRQQARALEQRVQNTTYDVIIQDSSDPWTGDGSYQVPLPSSVLYTNDHMQNIYRLLDPSHGVFVFQAEMLQIPSDLKGVAKWRQSALDVGFATSRYGSISIGSYPTGQIGFLMCEKYPQDSSFSVARQQSLMSLSPALAPTYPLYTKQIEHRINNRQREIEASRTSCNRPSSMRGIRSRFQSIKTKYYHPALQEAAFVLPLWAHQVIYGRENDDCCECQDEEKDSEVDQPEQDAVVVVA